MNKYFLATQVIVFSFFGTTICMDSKYPFLPQHSESSRFPHLSDQDLVNEIARHKRYCHEEEYGVQYITGGSDFQLRNSIDGYKKMIVLLQKELVLRTNQAKHPLSSQ